MSEEKMPYLPVEKPFFEGCEEGVLRLQYCGSCEQYQFYPRTVCAQCWSGDLKWVDASGRGRIRSFSVVRLPVSSAFEAPYTVALVELAEGPTLMSHIVGCEPEVVSIGDEVKASFADLPGDWTLPVFEPLTN